jgi:hypothetical protein
MAARVEKPRARRFPDGLGRINIKSLADREAVIRILIDRQACKSWGEPITLRPTCPPGTAMAGWNISSSGAKPSSAPIWAHFPLTLKL